MNNKFVFIKEIKSGTTRFQKPYPIITDQDNDTWHVFNQGVQLELNKAYVFGFSFNDKGFKDIEQITPVVNIWKQEALKEIASRNDIIRNYSIALGHALEYFSGTKPPLEEVFETAGQIYNFVDSKADAVMAEINKPIDKGI